MQEMNAQALKAHLDNCDTPPLLLDVRQPREFDICNIESSVLIPVSQIPAKAELPDKSREIVVICDHGIHSRGTGHYLQQTSFNRIVKEPLNKLSTRGPEPSINRYQTTTPNLTA